jgi:hypothetical protein
MVSHPESISAQQIGELIEYAKENYSDQINAAFVDHFQLYDPLSPAPDQIPVLFADSNIVVTPGCVEIRVDELWVMYKAFWSPARASPQCGGSGLMP